jgi:hypothetical protein
VTLRPVARFRSGAFSFLILCTLLLAGAMLSSLPAWAQERKVEGYVTAVAMPDGFDLNGEHVTLNPKTTYGVIGEKTNDGTHASADALRVGTFVRVAGTDDVSARRSMVASSVLFRDDWDKKLSGFGVIERVLTAGPEPVLEADGYRIRILGSTDLAFAGTLKTLADVGPNTWISYKGKRDAEGGLLATHARFVPARGWPKLTPRPKTHPVQEPVPAQGALMDADGKMVSLHAKVRLGDAGGYCGWHKLSTEVAMQDRVLRIGQRLVPAYQRQLGDDEPAKIWFRFYVVEEEKVREDIECNTGLILVPAKVMERIENDDELAALLANGIAYYLQVQSARLIAESWALLGAQLAADGLDFVPGVYPAVTAGNLIVSHEIELGLQEERGRMALSLLADAGFDPWQAPEVWRLIAPKRLPKDKTALKYPNRAGYQLSVLHAQYSSPPAAVAAAQ